MLKRELPQIGDPPRWTKEVPQLIKDHKELIPSAASVCIIDGKGYSPGKLIGVKFE